jgi:hypothetical protein
MKHPVVLALSLASLFSLAVVGCDGDDHHGHHRSGGDTTDVAPCNAAVRFDLSDIDAGIEKALPVKIKACFDRDCDVLTVSEQNGHKVCSGAPGGPPDQLTSCEIGADNKLSVLIVRVDGADYWDGQDHVAAISLQNQQALLVASFSEALNYGSQDSCLETVHLSAP